MANLTVNTKKYEQITLNTKPHSDPLYSVGGGTSVFLEVLQYWEIEEAHRVGVFILITNDS